MPLSGKFLDSRMIRSALKTGNFVIRAKVVGIETGLYEEGVRARLILNNSVFEKCGMIDIELNISQCLDCIEKQIGADSHTNHQKRKRSNSGGISSRMNSYEAETKDGSKNEAKIEDKDTDEKVRETQMAQNSDIEMPRSEVEHVCFVVVSFYMLLLFLTLFAVSDIAYACWFRIRLCFFFEL